MNIREEIDRYADIKDKPALHWLFNKYHLSSKWSFVATCVHHHYGKFSYQTHRKWFPTTEGKILYKHREKTQ